MAQITVTSGSKEKVKVKQNKPTNQISFKLETIWAYRFQGKKWNHIILSTSFVTWQHMWCDIDTTVWCGYYNWLRWCSRGQFIVQKAGYLVLPPSQITIRFGFLRYIFFAMYLDIVTYCTSRCIAKYMYLEKLKWIVIWKGGSSTFEKHNKTAMNKTL